MSLFKNPDYEAMTPREKVQWHLSEAALERVWYRRSYGRHKTRFVVCTAASERSAARHEDCAARLINHYRLKDDA
jgi:hypothetical protein